jgi:fructose/tagatose bisphosphate aldolase
LHSDHCAKKLYVKLERDTSLGQRREMLTDTYTSRLPWLDGMFEADEKHFKEFGTPLFSSHMIDLSEEPLDENIATTAKYVKRAAPMKMWIEMEGMHIHSCPGYEVPADSRQ